MCASSLAEGHLHRHARLQLHRSLLRPLLHPRLLPAVVRTSAASTYPLAEELDSVGTWIDDSNGRSLTWVSYETHISRIWVSYGSHTSRMSWASLGLITSSVSFTWVYCGLLLLILHESHTGLALISSCRGADERASLPQLPHAHASVATRDGCFCQAHRTSHAFLLHVLLFFSGSPGTTRRPAAAITSFSEGSMFRLVRALCIMR